MNGVDDIVFTAGIGENDDYVREQVCSYLAILVLILTKRRTMVSEENRRAYKAGSR